MDNKAEQEPKAYAARDSRGSQPAPDPQWWIDIAQRIGAGDPQSEAKLAARMRPGLQMVLMSRCQNDAEQAADLCQETLIIVLNRLRKRSIEDPTRLAGFAAQTARQLAFDNRRRSALRKTTFDTEAVEQAAVEAPVDDSVERESVIALVKQLLAELSHDRDREILRRFYLLEEEKADICRTYGLAPGAFDQLVFRARARMRSMLSVRGVTSRDVLCALGFWIPRSWLN